MRVLELHLGVAHRNALEIVRIAGFDGLQVGVVSGLINFAERIVRQRTLTDFANSEALHQLQSSLLAGEAGHGPRSPHTVKNYM
ncbi:MAG TPA: hypothetical protein PLD20_27720, partial [Blastocatellia bacterium]|nr:hypothetical protein [Blastocatellia bacterium]